MKKTFTLLSLLVLAGGFTAMAQPVFTHTVTYTVGDQLPSSSFNAQGVSAGNAGANQTWDFSGIQSTGSGTSEVVSVASTPYGSSYPTANVCIKTGNLYAYSLFTATENNTLGAYNGQANIVYSNPEKTLVFPFAYQQTLSDSWQASFTANGMNVTRYGQTTTKYDGYGTLITPAGTFTNAIRLKVEQHYYDLIPGLDTVFYDQVGYSWVKNGTRSLFAVNELTYSVSGISQTSYFGGYTPASPGMAVEENAAADALAIFPNPSNGEVTIQAEGLRFVNLLTLDGKTVAGFPISSSQTQLTLNVPAGLYIADCVYHNGQHTTRRLLVQ